MKAEEIDGSPWWSSEMDVLEEKIREKDAKLEQLQSELLTQRLTFSAKIAQARREEWERIAYWLTHKEGCTVIVRDRLCSCGLTEASRQEGGR